MKIIKTVVTEYEVTQVSDATMEYNQSFKFIRSGAKEKFDKCFNCDKSFKFEDKLHILFIKDSTNKVVCEYCAKKLKEAMNVEVNIEEGKVCGSCKSYLKPEGCGAVCKLTGEYAEKDRSCTEYK